MNKISLVIYTLLTVCIISNQVNAQKAIIELSKLNTLYVGVDNPIRISVPGISDSCLLIKIRGVDGCNGLIKKLADGIRSISVKCGDFVFLDIYKIQSNNPERFIESRKFRVKKMPIPSISYINGKISVNLDTDYDYQFKIVELTVRCKIGEKWVSRTDKGENLSIQQIDNIKKAKVNSRVYMENIQAKGDDGVYRNIGQYSYIKSGAYPFVQKYNKVLFNSDENSTYPVKDSSYYFTDGQEVNIRRDTLNCIFYIYNVEDDGYIRHSFFAPKSFKLTYKKKDLTYTLSSSDHYLTKAMKDSISNMDDGQVVIFHEIDCGVKTVDYDTEFSIRISNKRKRALIIGNSNYKSNPLKNPVNDAISMAKTLNDLDFEVVQLTDASLIQMKRAVSHFSDDLSKDKLSTGLFYYAGHGLQSKGSNYLVPVDAELLTETDVDLFCFNLDGLMKNIEYANNSMNIIILDACRNNPLSRSASASNTNGLSQIDAPSGTLIAFATAPGSVALDGTGENGLYTQELLKEMQFPDLKIEEVFKNVRKNVKAKSNGMQIPWENSSLEGSFFFLVK